MPVLMSQSWERHMAKTQIKAGEADAIATLCEELAIARNRIDELEDLASRANAITADQIEVAVGEALDTALTEEDDDRLLREVARRIEAGDMCKETASYYLLEHMEITDEWVRAEAEGRDMTIYSDDEIKEMIEEGVAESHVVLVAKDLILSRNDSDRYHFTAELRTELERSFNLN